MRGLLLVAPALSLSVALSHAQAPAPPLPLEALLARGHLDSAQVVLERAIALHPDAAEYRYWLGRTYHERMEQSGLVGKVRYARKAIAAFEDAVRLDPDHIDARVWLINYCWRAPGIVGGDREKAMRHLDQLARRDRLLSYRLEGTLWFQDGEYPLAAQAYRLVLQSDTESIEARYMLGRIAQETGDWDAALGWFRAVVDTDSTHLGAWYQQGVVLERLGLTDSARAAYQRALMLDPAHGDAQSHLARLVQTGR